MCFTVLVNIIKIYNNCRYINIGTCITTKIPFVFLILALKLMYQHDSLYRYLLNLLSFNIIWCHIEYTIIKGISIVRVSS